MSRPAHLARRFFGALRPGRPSETDRAWVRGILNDGEFALWTQLPGHDQRHAVGVARRVEQALAATPEAGDPRWLAAALLHDVGKLDSGLGVFARVGATLAGIAAGHERARAWSTRTGVTRRVGLYLCHPEVGAARIHAAGGRAEAASWAASHHAPAGSRSSDLPVVVVDALVVADDD